MECELLPKRSEGGLPRHFGAGERQADIGAERRARPGTLGPV